MLPDRDMPGRMAIAWPIPITIADGSLTALFNCFTKRVDRRINPVAISIAEVNIGLENASSKRSFSRRPARPAGIVPIIRYPNILRSVFISFLNIEMTSWKMR